ncbi:hypothetical protein SH2C18_04470 [Clostridium sediminicola]|uniref:hypothetical protein n=1 Tax=Clostridium sediminicola TaxID=3114879 RepID=UPI0031F1F216
MNKSEEQYYIELGEDYERRMNTKQYIDDLLNDNICIIDSDLPYDLVEDIKEEIKEDLINSRCTLKEKYFREFNEELYTILYVDSSVHDINLDVEIVTSVTDFINIICKSKRDKRFKSFYRGHSDWTYKLVQVSIDLIIMKSLNMKMNIYVNLYPLIHNSFQNVKLRWII